MLTRGQRPGGMALACDLRCLRGRFEAHWRSEAKKSSAALLVTFKSDPGNEPVIHVVAEVEVDRLTGCSFA